MGDTNNCGNAPTARLTQVSGAENTFTVGKELVDWINCIRLELDLVTDLFLGAIPALLTFQMTTNTVTNAAVLGQTMDYARNAKEAHAQLTAGELESALATLQRVTASIEVTLIESADAITGNQILLDEKLNANLEATISLVDELANGTQAKATQAIADNIQIQTDVIGTLDALTAAILEDGLARLSDVIVQTSSIINDNLIGFLDLIQASLFAIGVVLERDLESALTQGTEIADRIGGAIEALPAELEDTIRRLATDFAELLGDIITKLPDGLGASALKAIDDFSITADVESKEILSKISAVIATDQPISPIIEELLGHSLHKQNPLGGLILFGVLGVLIASLTGVLTQPEQARLLQTHSRIVSWQLLGVNELIVAQRRGFIDQDYANDQASAAGFTTKDIGVVRQLDNAQIGAAEASSWFLRGLLKEDEYTLKLEQLGFQSQDIAIIKQAIFSIPGPQDLIRFAVREVFSPDVADKFGIDQDFPSQFGSFAAQIGISEFWAKAYWGSHWELPSITAAFQMRHRDVIDDETLDLLLRAKDVMPFWREPFKKIAFNNFTRVDIRRMFSFGILDEAGVKRAYLDLGFNEEKAEAHLQFTVALNTPDEVDVTDLALVEIQNEVVESNSLGLITDDQAVTLLTNTGLTQATSQTLIDTRRLKNARVTRKEAIDIITDDAANGFIVFETAQQRLAALDLTQQETQLALGDILKKQHALKKQFSKADILGLQKDGIFTREVATEKLVQIGWGHTNAQILTRSVELKSNTED